jgi:hypothetical protein
MRKHTTGKQSDCEYQCEAKGKRQEMMTQRQKTDIRILQALFTDVRFESIFSAIDRLHDAASSGKLAEVTNLPADEVIGWLRDIVYTANETIREIEESAQSTCDWQDMVGTVTEPYFKN